MGMKLKKFLTNKNTVTLLCVLLAVGVLYVGYNWRVKTAVNPVKVPYAKETIQPKTKIDTNMIGYMEVAAASVKGGVITNVNNLIGKYSNVNTVIPKGSLFYTAAVVAESDLPDASLYSVPMGERLYYLPVNMTTTYGNSMVPGNYIDIYLQTTAVDEDGSTKVMVGQMLENVKILAVKTSNGLNVFENSEEVRVPATIIFSVSENVHLLLRKAALIGNLGGSYKVDIIPVPSTVSVYTPVGESIITRITSEYITDFIEEKSILVPIDQLDNNLNQNTGE